MLLALQNNLAAGGIEILVGLATESNAAEALILSAALNVGIAEETDEAAELVVAGFFVRAANEQDAASPASSFNVGVGGPGGIVYVRVPVPISMPAGERPKPPDRRPIRIYLGAADESNEALAPTLTRVIPLIAADDAASVTELAWRLVIKPALIERRERANALRLSKMITVQRASESRQIFDRRLLRAVTFELTHSKEQARAGRLARLLLLEGLEEHSRARAPKLTKLLAAGIARELVLARPITVEEDDP